MAKYRKRPEEVEAIQWMGDNWWDIKAFCPTCKQIDIVIRISSGVENIGSDLADKGDFLVKEESGFIHVVKEKVFPKIYEEIK